PVPEAVYISYLPTLRSSHKLENSIGCNLCNTKKGRWARTISDGRSVAERILLSRFVVCFERICVDVALCHVDNLTMALDVKPRLKELKRALLRPKCRVCVPAFELGLEQLPVVAPDPTVHRGEAVGICIANQINRALSVDGAQRHSRVVTARVGCIDPA